MAPHMQRYEDTKLEQNCLFTALKFVSYVGNLPLKMRDHATLKLSLRLILSMSSYHCSEIYHLMAKTTRLKRSIHV